MNLKDSRIEPEGGRQGRQQIGPSSSIEVAVKAMVMPVSDEGGRYEPEGGRFHEEGGRYEPEGGRYQR
ncbi:MAG TPA: hypothetical protein VEK57_30075 [Thermoanaerobaculia bacterium]|nr:hypothetical protein [Thermoanaerobaculia bacterium]